MSTVNQCARIRPSAEACKSSTYARYKVLVEALKTREKISDEVKRACSSAGALAAMDAPHLGALRLGSRNTLFKYADLVLNEPEMCGPNGETGWRYLDWLRKEVKSKASKQAAARTVDARQVRNRERDENSDKALTQLQKVMSAQSRAYLWLLNEISGMAKNDRIEAGLRQRLNNLLNQHDELFSYLFEPDTSKDLRPDNVIRIESS